MLEKIQNANPFLLSLISGILLWAAWPPSPLFPLIFIAFALLFLAERNLNHGSAKRKGRRWFFMVFFAMVLWNFLTTYWIYFATQAGGVGPAAAGAWIANAVFMALPFVGYRIFRKRYGLKTAMIAFMAFWLCFEFIHFSWELAWPWLALGNVFAKFPALVQWYDILGVSGGTLWVLLINIFIFRYFFSPKSKTSAKRKVSTLLPLLIIPIVFSVIRFYTYNEKGYEVNVLAIQPNIDPYTEKFADDTGQDQLAKMYSLAKDAVQENTDYIVFPETSLPESPWMHDITSYVSLNSLRSLMDEAELAKVIVGVDLFERYLDSTDITPTSRYYDRGDYHYDLYNAAMQLSKTSDDQYYMKSKLVPGVERMPYPKQLKFLQKLTIDLGGAAGSRGTQPERTIFVGGRANVAPVICYESIFGDYVTEFVRNGANLIFIITNDGWWKDTPGYKQHLMYASLRAIENRRSIARSANTGISGFIDQRGVILNTTEWWEADAIHGTILANNETTTIFTRWGDVLGRLALLVTLLLLLRHIVGKLTKNFKYR